MSACVHRWRLEEPEGRTGIGVCVHCGGERRFANSLESKEKLLGEANGADFRHRYRTLSRGETVVSPSSRGAAFEQERG